MKQNIIAVDFDGTLCENKWPEIGMPNEELIEYLKKRQANGEKLILWTSRNEEQTKEAVEWCKKYGLIFDAVNDNVESYYEGETDILLKDIKRDGYKFLGWYTTSDYKEDSRITIIDKDAPETLELYAKWEKIEYQVKKDNIEENPNTYTTTYVIAGIFIILMLSTVAVYVYGKKNNI